MKVVQFMASEGWGGAESVFVELSNALSVSCQITALLLRGTQYHNRFSSDVEVVALSSNPTRYNPLLVLEIYLLLQKIRPDIVHTHAVKGTELVYSVNHFLHIPHVGTKHNVRRGKIFNKLGWVTAVSQACEKTIHVHQGANLEVIYNGINPVNIDDIAKYNVFTILAVGRLDSVKGFDILINQVCRLDFDFRLLIVGEGPEKQRLNVLLREKGMQDRVFLTGFKEEIPQMMKKAHLVVVSSHAEGFSRVLVEGLFYADVVISTPVGVAAEILPPIFIVSQDMLGDKIDDVHRNFAEYQRQFARTKDVKSGNFLLPTVAERYKRFYQNMLDGNCHDRAKKTNGQSGAVANITPERKA